MDDLRTIPAENFPMIAKVVALKLPMETIKGFASWLAKEHPTLAAGAILENIDRLLYNYYNVDVAELHAEVEQRNGLRNRV